MATNLRLLLFLGSFLAVASCAAPQTEIARHADSNLPEVQAEDSALHRIHSKVVFIDHQRRPVDINNFPKGLNLIFAVVPGQIHGMSQGKVVQSVQAEIGSDFQLDLDGMELKIRDRSTTLMINPYTEGLLVIPSSTQFSRLGTLAVDPTTGKPVGWTSFMDSESSDSLILIYVDQPCSFTGTIHVSGESYKYEISLKTPGFHWIRSYTLGDHDFLFKEHIGRGEVFFFIQNRDQIL
jgi:hypothetical protein